MTDARPIDLSYGHFGELSYDVRKGVWMFPRNLENAPLLRIVGAPRVLISSQTSPVTSYTDHTAATRRRTVEQLVQTYPELVPSSAPLLYYHPAEAPKTNEHLAPALDATYSDRIAFGRAQNYTHSRRYAKSVSVVAVVDGATGGLVRVFQSKSQVFGSESQPRLTLETEILQLKLQGIWSGTGSPVQQLQFAQANGEPTEWLAVRHGQGTSILRVVLRESAAPALHKLCEMPAAEANVEFRFVLQHIATLSRQRSGGASHADVCFNPWNPWEFAVLDQSLRWSTWRVKSVSKKPNAWTLDARHSGRCTTLPFHNPVSRPGSQPSTDGWGALKWIRNGTGLLICGRTAIATVEFRDMPHHLPLPGFGLCAPTEWILDIKQSPTDQQYVFILTSSRVLWAYLNQNDVAGSSPSQPNARLLLAWTHFRSEHDTSLTLQIIGLRSMILVVLYSRLTGLKTVFTFESGKGISRIVSSAPDPYILPGVTCGSQPMPTYATLLLRAVNVEVSDHRSGEHLDTAIEANDISFLKCWTLTGDLSLHECFLAHSSLTSHLSLEASGSLGRRPVAKSTYKIQEDFIVPNGYVQDPLSVRLIYAGRPRSDIPSLRSGQYLPNSRSQRTINLEGLAQFTSLSPVASIEEILELILDRIHDDFNPNVDARGMVSLYEYTAQEIAPGDIEEDSAALQDLARRIEERYAACHLDPEYQPRELEPLPRWTLDWLPWTLRPHPDGTLSQSYDAHVQSWIKSLAPTVPGRIRSSAERQVRGVAAQLQLASYGLRFHQDSSQLERQPQRASEEAQATFTLPVRAAQSSLRHFSQGIATPAEQTSSNHPQRMHGSISSLSAANLPTPAPTPTLQSKVSPSTKAENEDTATQRLRTLTSLTSHPPWPSVLSGILDHWSIGQNPDNYDWDASKTRLDNGDRQDDVEEAGQMKKRRRTGGVKERQWDGSERWSQLASQFAASQVDAPTYIQPSSQSTPMTASQPQWGRFGSGKTVKKGRSKPGF
ncbi:MAG: hypothetical protein Q9218_000193 [Villophora microphyllina]